MNKSITISFLMFLATLACQGQTYNYGALTNPTQTDQPSSSDYKMVQDAYNGKVSQSQYNDYLLSNFADYKQRKQAERALKDTVKLNEKSLFADPKKLEKLGFSTGFIEELGRLGELEDSLFIMRYKFEQMKEGRTEEEINLSFLEAYIESQKNAILHKFLELPYAQIYGHDFFRKSYITLDAEDEFIVNANTDYVISIGDLVSIQLWGYSDLNYSLEVDELGNINVPVVGSIAIRGLTVSQAELAIKNRLGQIYGLRKNNIKVNVSYNQRARVNVVGEVFNPGTYRVSSIYSAFDILVAIDGPNDLGSVRNIYIRRNGKTIKTLDVYEYLQNPDSNQDYFLGENDYIVVPPVGGVVHITGAVKRPFNYEIKKGEDIQDVIGYAGGLNANAFTQTIGIKRFANNKAIWIDVPLDSLRNNKIPFEAMNGDTIFINQIPDYVHNYVLIGGAVRAQGTYDLNEGDRISDLVYRAEGPIEIADMERAYLFRLKDDLTRKVIPFNPSEVLINQASAQNLLLQAQDSIYFLSKEMFKQELGIEIAGDVGVPGQYDYVDGMTLQDFIYIAGGMRKEAAGSIIEISRLAEYEGLTSKEKFFTIKRIEIGIDLKVSKQDASFALMPYDRVFVRRNPNIQVQQNIKLTGEVLYPGEYALTNKKEKVSSVIERAGGTSSAALLNGAILYRVKKEYELNYNELQELELFNEEKADIARKFQIPVEEVQPPIFYSKMILDLENVLNKPGKSIYDYILTDGDSLHVPKIENVVTLVGAVRHFDYDTLTTTLKVPFEPKKDARYYIQKYGAGFGQDGRRGRTYVQQPNGEIEKAQQYFFVRKYPKVEQGATVFVDYTDRKKNEAERKEQKEERDWNRAFESFSSKVATILTILVLVQQARN